MPQWKKQENVQRSTQVQFWREGKKRDKSQILYENRENVVHVTNTGNMFNLRYDF